MLKNKVELVTASEGARPVLCDTDAQIPVMPIGRTQSASVAYSGQGTRINPVSPGCIHTPMVHALEQDASVKAALIAAHPIGRLGLPDEVAEPVVWLASDRASFVTGSCHPVDGGYLAR